MYVCMQNFISTRSATTWRHVQIYKKTTSLHLPNHPLHSGHEISLDAISPLF